MEPAGLYAVLRPRLRRVLSRFESIHADIVAELVFASSGMMRPFPCAIFLAYNNCAGLTGFGSRFPTVSPPAFLGACSLRNCSGKAKTLLWYDERSVKVLIMRWPRKGV